MREKLLVNDAHIGVQRSGGTTPASAFAIRAYLLTVLRDLLFKHLDKDLIINGDLADAFSIALFDLLELHGILREWLLQSREEGFNAGPTLTLGRGNHDISKDSAKLSSFDFLARLLKAEFGDRVQIVTEPAWIDDRIFMIPHMPNQDLFDLALDQVIEVDNQGLLLLHANYDNGYTLESDHSLNVSKEQVEKLIAKGWTLVIGHEHQARWLLKERVIITGNQWPSSIADCLNNPGSKKYAHIIHENLDLSQVETWSARGSEFDDYDFAEIDWQTLGEVSEGIRFIRVVGEATADEAPQVIEAISTFRRSYDAFVVSNAVKIEGVADMEDLQVSVEEMKAFDVVGYLLEQLDPRQQEVVKDLLKKEQQEGMRQAA